MPMMMNQAVKELFNNIYGITLCLNPSLSTLICQLNLSSAKFIEYNCSLKLVYYSWIKPKNVMIDIDWNIIGNELKYK